MESGTAPSEDCMWPPSHTIRLILIERMTKFLSTPSVFSRTYGLLSTEEAEKEAKKIEKLAFAVAVQHCKESHGDRRAVVQEYANETSSLMLEVIKRGPTVKDEEKADKISIVHEYVFDISGGPWAFIDAEEAKDILKPLRESKNSYTKICFNNRSFGMDAANVAAPILSSIKQQLAKVDLSNFVAGRPESEALEVMNLFSSALEGCQLTYINLSNNALGQKGIRAFGALFKSQNNLEELYLINDGISEEAARAVSELVPSTEKLKVLQFHSNMTGDEGAIAISEIVKRSHALEDFRCSSARVGIDGGVALAEALKSCTHLKKLDLSDNMFGVEAGVALSKALCLFASLSEVYLSYLNLEDDGAEALANVLKEYAPSLEVLEMAGNDITAKGAASLAVCIASKQFLTKINLAENELKDEGAILIGKALGEGHNQLSKVDMSANAVRRAGARLLAQAVVKKPGFEWLNINGNLISDKGVDELKEFFKSSPEKLAPLDENDPEGEDYDDKEQDRDRDEYEENAEDGGELDSKLEDFKIEQGE